MAEREVVAAVVPGRRQHLVQQVAVTLDAADAVADPGGVGATAQGRERVGTGVDDGDVVAEAGERDGEHPAAPADVENAQRRAGADHRVQRRPDGSAPDGQLLGGAARWGRRHPGKPSGGDPGSPARSTERRPRPQASTLSAARLISAMSMRRICSIAWVARCARPWSGSLSSS